MATEGGWPPGTYTSYYDPSIEQVVTVTYVGDNVVTNPANRGVMTAAKAAALTGRQYG